jgi:hypothetical protein
VFLVHESYDTKTFVLSCSVAVGARWTHFEDAWRGVLATVNASLASQGRRQISRYHATYCAGMSDEYEGWSVEEQKTFTAALIAALRKVPMQTFAYTLLLDDLRDTWADRKGVQMNHSDMMKVAYFFTMQHCMIEFGSYIYPLNPSTRITIIHDHSDYDELMLSAFNYVKYKLNAPFADVFATIAPMNSKECLPLQLADFFAYECFKDRGGEEGKGELYKRRKSLDLTLAAGTGLVLKTLKREWIEEIMTYNGA